MVLNGKRDSNALAPEHVKRRRTKIFQRRMSRTTECGIYARSTRLPAFVIISSISEGSFTYCRRRRLGNAMRVSWMRQRRTSQSEAATEARNVFEFLMRRKTLIHPY